MQHAFERAVGRLFVRLGVLGTYRRSEGAELAARFIAKGADVIEAFGESRLAVDTCRFDVQAAEVARPVEGDTFMLHGRTYRVIGAPVADRDRLVWTLTGAPL